VRAFFCLIKGQLYFIPFTLIYYNQWSATGWPFNGDYTIMNLTKLEKEIIEHRLEVPDAMAEVLADSFDISYEKALDLYDERLPGLMAKLVADKLLDKWEVEAVRDVATDNVYADMAEDAIGFHWEDGKEMTPQWASRIWNTSENLHNKLMSIISSREIKISRTFIGGR
tara:strand:- start:450 stop:956 length:507 start_codon:yes stop_codon:yes gene_type:complete